MQNESDNFEVVFKKELYDITSFLPSHPGGINYLERYKQKDVSKQMESTKHSKAALYLLQEYKKYGKRKTSGHQEDEEDLERLVDWSKPMLHQVASLGNQYKEWVISPVDRQLRLFENPILENLTITPWYVVPIIWIPIIIYLMKIGAEHYVKLTKDPSPVLPIVLYIALGTLIWSLLEYSLHRWVFHMEPSGNSKIMIYFHFTIHGLHHKVPFDTRRLVFPPFPAALITLVMYKLLSLVVPEFCIVLISAGGLSGYLIYDMIHYYLHYGCPDEKSYFYHLKRCHNQHHFAHHDSGFGISSVFWDKIFGTAIHLRQLKVGIKW